MIVLLDVLGASVCVLMLVFMFVFRFVFMCVYVLCVGVFAYVY